MNPVYQYEPHDAPDPMKRDGLIALAAVCLVALGLGTLVVGVGRLLRWLTA